MKSPPHARSPTPVRHSSIGVDHLDFWAALHLIRRPPTGRIVCLTRSTGFCARFVVSLLRRRGIRVDTVTSPLVERPAPGYYAEFMERKVDCSINHVEPAIARTLADWHFANDLERRRTVRYLLLAHSRVVMRQTELVEAAIRLDRADGPVAVLMQKDGLSEGLAGFARASGLEAEFYRAPFRLRMTRRPDLGTHETDLWSGEAALRHVLRWFALVGLNAGALLRRQTGGAPPEFDIIALTARPSPTPEIDDLYWLDDLRRTGDVRIGLFYTTPVSTDARTRYGGRLDGPYEIAALTRGRQAGCDLGRQFLACRLRGIVAAGKRIVGPVLRRRLPVAFGAALLTLWERASLYEALMLRTGARVGWAMNEGHELNTQAIAIAAARTGGIVAGSTWSIWFGPQLDSALNRNDVMFVWGERHVRLFEASAALIDSQVIAGYPSRGFRDDDSAARDIVARWRHQDPDALVLCLYDNAAAQDFPVVASEIEGLYRAIVNAMDRRSELRLILKTKRPDLASNSLPFRSDLERLFAEDRIAVVDRYGDLAPGLAADVVIGVSASSLGLMCAHRGKPFIAFDPSGILIRYPARGLADLRIVEGPEQLETALIELTADGEKRCPASDDIDGFADTAGARRAAQYLNAVVAAAREGASRDEMIDSGRREAESWRSCHTLEKTA